jgi:hypothetical protein
MQRQIFNSHHGRPGNIAGRFGAFLAMTGLLLLSACESRDVTTDTSQLEPTRDGVPPTLTTVTVQPDGLVEVGDSVRIDLVASEAILTPVVYINNVRADVSGSVLEWRATRQITDTDPVGDVTFSISYQDVSGELGQAVTTTTNDSVACIGVEGVDCPLSGDIGPLEGSWQLDFAGVGPNAGDTSWFSISDTGIEGERHCWFNDTYQLGRDGSFSNIQGDETWVEPWQGALAEGCDAPVAPHDGSNNAVFEYDEEAATLKLTGIGAFIGLAKVVNGAELTDPSEAPESVTYEVVELIGDSLTVRIDYGGGWWEYRLSRISTSPIVGKWKLNFAGVGPNAGDTSWFSISDTGPDGERACWFDDIYNFGADGSFQNFQEGETWVEPWQGALAESCGAPVAPHDGSSAGGWLYDEDGGTTTLDGVGLYLGLAKVVNGAELADPSEAPEWVTYEVVELIGDSLTVRIDYGGGWWEYQFDRVADTTDLRGNWKLEFAGVGPNAGDTSWFSISDTGIEGERHCWFNDTYQFGADGSFFDGSFRNVQGDETWVEPWQGALAEACDAPVAPHDGSNNAIFEHDDEAATLKLTGIGAYIGLAKVVNGAELTDPSEAPESVTYEVVELIGESLTVRIDYGGGWWEYRLRRISNEPIVGNWKLDFAGVGPNAGDTSWFSISAADGERACWFDDIYHVSDDGSFQNFQEGQTWVEPWQGALAEGCGTPVAPHDGSSAGGWLYDEDGGTTTLDGVGLYLGLAKVVNGAELTDPSEAPEWVAYEVVELIGSSLTVRIDYGGGWWQYELVKDE